MNTIVGSIVGAVHNDTIIMKTTPYYFNKFAFSDGPGVFFVVKN